MNGNSYKYKEIMARVCDVRVRRGERSGDTDRFNTSSRYPQSRSILGPFRKVYCRNEDDATARKTGPRCDEEADRRRRRGRKIEGPVRGAKYMK